MDHNRQHSADGSASQDRSLSIDFLKSNPKSSTIYSLLQSAVQNRLPRLNSIRKSVYTYALHVEMDEDRSSGGNGRKTFPAGCGSEMVLRDAQSDPESTEFASYLESRSGLLLEEENKPAQVRSKHQFLESKSVIDWKFANQGLNLLSLSAEESATISQNSTYGNTSFARQLYLHGLTYLLRGLPIDLTSEEQLIIKSSLPRPLLIPQELNTSSQSSVYSESQAKPPPPPSILHKLLASTIVQLFILVQFLLPYLKFLLRCAHEYERTHHISEKVLASSIDIADTVGKQSLAMIAALYGMGHGKMGQALTEAASWFVEGITGGIHDGVGEGLNIMGVKKEARE